MVRGRDDRVREMASFFAPNNPLGFLGQDMNITCLRSIIRLVGSTVGPEVDLDDPDDPELLASAQVEISIFMLSRLPSDDASRALDDLVGDDALVEWRTELEQAQYGQGIVRRDASYRHPSIREVRETLSNLAPSNAKDLAVLLTDKLNDLANRIRTANTDDWLQYWNEDPQGRPVKPKHEEHCRDALLSDLRGLLPDGVVAEPEGEYSNDMPDRHPRCIRRFQCAGRGEEGPESAALELTEQPANRQICQRPRHRWTRHLPGVLVRWRRHARASTRAPTG